MSFSSDLREELIEINMWDNNSSLKQDEQLSRLLIREAFIKKGFINNPNKDYNSIDNIHSHKIRPRNITRAIKDSIIT